MTKVSFLIVAGSFCASLSACGGGGTEMSVDDGKGGETHISMRDSKAGLAAPDNLPAFAPLYPGARVDNVVFNAGQPHKGVVAYTVKAEAEDVIAFYKSKGTNAGLKAAQEMNTSSSRMLVMAKTALGGDDIGMQVNVMPSMQDQGSVTVSLVYSGPE